MVERHIEMVTCKEIVIAIKAMKSGKAARPCEICAKMIFNNKEVWISVIIELCHACWMEKKYWINDKLVC